MNERSGAAADPAEAPGTGRVVEAERLRKVFVGGDGNELTVLDGVDFAMTAGEVVAIVGASGAGKSTLLHLLGGLDRPTEGEIRIGGRALSTLPDERLAALRNASIGFVFQFHHLLRGFSALENVMLPQLVAGVERARARERASELLEEVGLGERVEHHPTQLSGGEQQRVAVARALANRPALVLADEPSGNLDTGTSERLHKLFFRLRRDHGVAIVLATHNRELADRADRVLLLQGGEMRDFYPA